MKSNKQKPRENQIEVQDASINARALHFLTIFIIFLYIQDPVWDEGKKGK